MCIRDRVFLAAGGVEPALAGVLVGVLIPGRPSPLRRDPAARVEHALAPIAAYIVLPLFAVANAGVAVHSSILRHPGATAAFVGIVVAPGWRRIDEWTATPALATANRGRTM